MPAQLHRWEELPNQGEVYSPRTGHAVVNDGTCFYVFGGTDGAARLSDVHSYNLELKVWQPVEATGQAPQARSGAQVVLLDGVVWFFGGYTKKDGEYFSDVYEYNIATLEWSFIPTLGDPPSRRTDHSVVLYQRSMFVFGGFDGRNRFNDMRQLQIGEPEKRWSNISSTTQAPSSRFGHTAVLYEHSMFIFGGWDGHNTMMVMFEYNFPFNQWSQLAPRGQPPRARYRHSAVMCGDCMYTFGGVDKMQVRFHDLHEFNITNRTWTDILTSGQIPTARTFHKPVVHQGYMYILGGFDGRRQNDVHRILLKEEVANSSNGSAAANSRARAVSSTANPAVGDDVQGASALMPEDFWHWQEVHQAEKGRIYTPRTGHEVVVYNNKFYLMGGTDENARQNDIYKFDVASSSWELLPPVTCDEPSGFSARSGAKAVTYRDNIYFFGGYTKKDVEYFNDIYEFNIPRAHWNRLDVLGPKPPKRTDHSCCIFGPIMYIFGGFDGKTRFQDLQQFSIDDKTWTTIPDGANAPIGRFGHSACTYRASMFVFGGWNGYDTLDDLTEFSTTTSKWFSIPGRGEVPAPRYRHSAVVYGCCMFLFGGVDKRQERFNDLYQFDFDMRNWARVVTHGIPPSSRTFHRAVMYSGYMYILGGFDGQRRNDMHRIPILETLARDQKVKRRRLPVQENAPDQDDDGDMNIDEEETALGRMKALVLELQRRLEREEEHNICKVCFEREIDAVVMQCAHRVVCLRCSAQLTLCPVCRRTISNVIQTYSA